MFKDQDVKFVIRMKEIQELNTSFAVFIDEMIEWYMHSERKALYILALRDLKQYLTSIQQYQKQRIDIEDEFKAIRKLSERDCCEEEEEQKKKGERMLEDLDNTLFASQEHFLWQWAITSPFLVHFKTKSYTSTSIHSVLSGIIKVLLESTTCKEEGEVGGELIKIQLSSVEQRAYVRNICALVGKTRVKVFDEVCRDQEMHIKIIQVGDTLFLLDLLVVVLIGYHLTDMSTLSTTDQATEYFLCRYG